ncbi:MAG: hypothetical protein EB824_06180, partial [Thaumarchaeota archaeon S15]
MASGSGAGLTPSAIACAAAALSLAALAAAYPSPWAAAQAPPAMELLHAGAAAKPPLLELHASPEPAVLEIVAGGVGEGAEVSVRVVRHSNWGGAAGEPPAEPALADHGGGEATLVVDRSSPGELVLEAAATGPAGGARALYVVRVLDALPPPGGQDRAAPSHIVGHVDPADPALPRMLAQAGRPLCAQAGASGMSGVPPIEGTGPDRWHRATFGQQVEQWVHLDGYRGPDRVHYYMQFPPRIAPAEEGHLKSPYTNKTETFASSWALPRAAAPGPYWGDREHAFGGGDVDLHYRVNGTEALVTVRVIGTSSFVPELLPLDGVVRILATGFHTDGVEFRTGQPRGAPLAPPGLPASINGTLVPTEPAQEPHYHGYGKYHKVYLNGTKLPHDREAHKREAVAADLADPATPAEPHHHNPPAVVARASVSEVALRNGILVEGITDGGGSGGMEVKKLHEVTLAAELPVGVGDVDLYERVG